MRRASGPARIRWLLLAAALAGCTAPSAPPVEHPGAHGAGAFEASAFDRSVEGLPAARAPEVVRLADGATWGLEAAPVAHDPGVGRPLRMLAYNGQLPGPVLRVPQGARASVDFTNHLAFPSTVHWHGLRLDPRFDGVPGLSQEPVAPGATFRYELSFPDEGVYWYHAHVREDLQQEWGLAGLLLVEGPEQRAGQGPREVPLVLDDLAVEGGDLAPYSETPNRTLMGRYGTRYLVNGQPSLEAEARPGERVRLLLLDAANARPLRLQATGAARAEWVASDGGYLVEPRPAAQVVLGPGERAVLDVVMPASGEVVLHHRPSLGPSGFVPLARFRVAGDPARDEGAPPGPHERARASIEAALPRAEGARALSWELDMTMDMAAFASVGHQHGSGRPPPIEWEDEHPLMNRASDVRNVRWILRDAATGAENMDLAYTFAKDSYARLRIDNLATSMHPMQHPIHLHGQRFLVLLADGQANPALAWKDTVTVPAGSSVDLLVEMSNPGRWMYHCHISEHMEAGMMGTLTVA